MANKNTTGSTWSRFKDREERMLKLIDKRTYSGKDRKNVGPTRDEYKLTTQGERVWSF